MSDRRLLDLEDQIKFLLKGPQTTYGTSSTNIPQAYVKAVSSDTPPRSLNETPRQNSFTFCERFRPNPQPKALETNFEAQVRDYMVAHTERMERMEEEKSVENNGVAGKMECEAYHSIPVEPMCKVMLKKMITKKEDMGGNFVIPCNLGGLKYMDALVDQGSDVNVMPLSTYNRLTNKKLQKKKLVFLSLVKRIFNTQGISEEMTY
ncbi:hypothetical protein Tco_0895407 [Tanacetum coccineum]|uniref:Aspartic peptidase DDI1-type domain-containing protein n=1 Tax=Tanacetum coccineum TaxID=301880 RepID=A0ABQ5CEJ0_9ASTR